MTSQRQEREAAFRVVYEAALALVKTWGSDTLIKEERDLLTAVVRARDWMPVPSADEDRGIRDPRPPRKQEAGGEARH